MKKAIFLLILFLSLRLQSQEVKEDLNIQFEIGFLAHLNILNEDNYLENKSPFGLDDRRIMTGLDMRFILPTKFDFLDITIGSLVEKCWDEYNATSDYILNGGGVYAGVSPKFKGRHFGITSLFAVGVLSYKEYFSYYSDSSTPVVDIYEKKSSFGLGAISSVGLYGKIGRIGINPQAQAIFSGGSNASFLFYGFLVPLTIQF